MHTLLQAVRYFFEFMKLLILVRVILSWIPNLNVYSPLVRFIYDATEPIMRPVREFLSRYLNTGPIDLSPILALFLLGLVERLVIRLVFFL